MSTHIEPFEAMDSRPWKIVNTYTFLIMNGRGNAWNRTLPVSS